MAEPVCIAIVGAESTGKTALAQALAQRLGQLTGQRCTWVPEHLRAWCTQHGRTPRIDEQHGIAQAQQAQIEAALADHDWVVCDTTPVMTAVYSKLIFGDSALDAPAAAWHRCCQLTLLTALDLPWVADGLQRDGPQVREPVDAALRGLLDAHRLHWSRVRGQGPARLAHALAALAPWLPAEVSD